MITLENIKNNIAPENVELQQLIHTLTEDNYVEKIRKLTYSQKLSLLIDIYDGELDELFTKDKNFMTRFKYGYSYNELLAKGLLSKEELDTYFNVDQIYKECENDPEKLTNILSTLDYFEFAYQLKSNILNKFFSNDKIIDLITKNDNDAFEKLMNGLNTNKIKDTVVNNEKLQNKYIDYIIDSLNSTNKSLNTYLIPNLPDKIKDEIISRINKDVDIKNIETSKFEQLVYTFTNSNDINSQKRLEGLISNDYTIFKEKSDDFFNIFMNKVNSPEIVKKILEDEGCKEKLFKNQRNAEKLLSKDIGIDNIKNIIENLEEKIFISDVSKDAQEYILTNYSNFTDKVFLNNVQKLDESVINLIVNNKDAIQFLNSKDLVECYEAGKLKDKQIIIDKLMDESSFYIRADTIPKDILDSLDKDQRITIFKGLSDDGLFNTMKLTDDPILKAVANQKVENTLEKKLNINESTYYIADETQKGEILEQLNINNLVKLYVSTKDNKILDYLLNSEEKMKDISNSYVQDLLQNVDESQFNRIVKNIDKHTIINCTLNSDKYPQMSSKLSEYRNSILNEDITLYRELDSYSLHTIFKDKNVDEQQKILSVLKSENLIDIYSTIKDNNLKNKSIEYLINNLKEDNYISSFTNISSYLEKIPIDKANEIINNLSLNNKIELYGDLYENKSELANNILENIKNNVENDYIRDDKYFYFNFNTILKKLDENDRKELLDYISINNLIPLYNKNNENSTEIKNVIVSKYQDNITKVSKLPTHTIQNFLENIPNDDAEKVYRYNIDYINNNYDIKNSKLNEIISNNNITEQLQIMKILDNNMYQGQNREKIDYLLSKNQYVLRSLNLEMLSDEFKDYNIDLLEKLSRYPEIQHNLISQKDSSNLANFNMMINNLVEGNSIEKTLPTISNLYNEVFVNENNKDVLNLLDDKINVAQAENLKEYLLRNRLLLYGQLAPEDVITPEITKKEDIYNYTENLYKKCDEIFYNSSDIEERKNALCTRFLGMSYNEMKLMYKSYADGITSLEDKSSTPYKNSIYMMTTLLAIEKNETLNDVYDEFSKKRGEISRESAMILEGNMKECIAKEISNSLYKVNNENQTSIDNFRQELNNCENKNEFDMSKVPIIHLDDDFKLLVHSTAAYGKMEHINSNYLDSWNNSDRTKNHGICCSMIADDYLGTAKIKDVLLGFDNIAPTSLQYEAPYDLYTENDKLHTSANRKTKYLNSTNMINNTRHTHNEIDIERTDSQGNTEFNNIQPSYVIVFDDMDEELKNNALKCAIDFKIPVLEINKEQCANKNAQKIDSIMEEFEKNGNLSLVKDIMVKHENNRSGLRLERPDLVEKYFPTEKVNNLINKTISDIVQSKEKNDISLEEYQRELKYMYSIIKLEEDKFDVTNETVARINTIDIDTLKFKFDINKNCSYYTEKVSKIDNVLQEGMGISLDTEEIKNINEVKREALEISKSEKTDYEIDSFERKTLYTNRLINNLDLEDNEKALIFAAQKYELLNSNEKKEFLNKNNVKSMNRNDRVLTTALEILDIEDDPVKLEISKIKHRITDKEYESVSNIVNVIKNSRSIELGEFEKLDLNEKQKNDIENLKTIIDQQYSSYENKKRNEVQQNDDIKRRFNENSNPVI